MEVMVETTLRMAEQDLEARQLFQECQESHLPGHHHHHHHHHRHHHHRHHHHHQDTLHLLLQDTTEVREAHLLTGMCR